MSAARFLRPASFLRDIREERQKPTVDRILMRAENEPSVKASTRAFSLLKASTSAFTFKTLC